MSLTIHDIAKLSGVSKSTVSRALTGSTLVKEDTKRKVMEAAETLDYKPNAIARAMVTKKTGNIAFLIYRKRKPLVAHSFFGHIIDAAMDELTKYGYHMFVSATNDYKSTFSEHFVQKMIDGAILISQHGEDVVKIFRKHSIPIVLLNNSLDYEDLCCVLCDNYKGAFEAVEYLIKDRGHKNIGLISGPLEHESYSCRYKAFIDAHLKYGIGIDYNSIRISESSVEEGYTAMTDMLSAGKRPSAVFAVTDILAIGAMKAIKSAGLGIPDDIAVMGFDDIDYSSMTEPRLSTVWVDKESMGKLAVQALLCKISGEQIEKRVFYAGTKLVIRESS